MRFLLITAVCILLSTVTAAAADTFPGLEKETDEWDVDGLELLLPQHETAAERTWYEAHPEDLPPAVLVDDPPPLGPIRNCAEWEPSTGVLVRYPLGLPYDLLRDFDDDVIVYVVVSSGYQTTAYNNLNANGVDMSKVEFVVCSNDSIWTRDYGPWFVFDGFGDIAIIDHTYNRPWRPNDNLVPIQVGQQLGIPVHSHSMYHTGGNYMTDGAHISSSTRLVYDEAQSENGMNSGEVDQLMLDYYGVQNYEVLDYIESGGIHHIDTWAKFLDEETVLVKDVWSGHWTYSALNQRATLLASLPASTGRNYQVHRIYCYDIGGSSPASYTNSLILNDNIYVPTFGNGIYDEQALTAYRNAAPGYTVRGYYYGGFISDDALHCRAKGILDANMLRVQHIPILEDQPWAPVTVTASMRPHGPDGLTSAILHWRHDGGDWQTTDLLPTGTDWEYEANIPAPASTSACDYYISASDAGGRSESMPRVAPARLYQFLHNGDPNDPGTLKAFVEPGLKFVDPLHRGGAFSFELEYADHAELVVIDARGRHVRTLLDGICSAGTTEVSWNGTDDDGNKAKPGTYFFRLRAAGLQYSRATTLAN